jgi:hypothetical protein
MLCDAVSVALILLVEMVHFGVFPLFSRILPGREDEDHPRR